MIRIKGLKDFGIWLKKGEITEANNSLARHVIKKGYAKVVGKMPLEFKLLKKYNLNYLADSFARGKVVEILKKFEMDKTSKKNRGENKK